MIETESPFAVFARYQKSAPVDVESIARDLGIKVYKERLGENIFGMLVRDHNRGGNLGYAIYVNVDNHPNRQRFTIAHEIAHFALHRDLMDSQIVDDTMYRSHLGSIYETQANRLAADILMPIRLLKLSYQTDKSAQSLARKFGVSTAAMEIRLKALRSSVVAEP